MSAICFRVGLNVPFVCGKKNGGSGRRGLPRRHRGAAEQPGLAGPVAQVGQAQDMETGGRAFVAVDVHYLSSGGARAAAVVAADARFGEIVAERTQVVSEVLPYRPGLEPSEEDHHIPARRPQGDGRYRSLHPVRNREAARCGRA